MFRFQLRDLLYVSPKGIKITFFVLSETFMKRPLRDQRVLGVQLDIGLNKIILGALREYFKVVAQIRELSIELYNEYLTK